MIPKFRAWDKKRKVMYVGVGIFQEESVPRCVFGGGIDPLDAVLLDEVELMMSTGLRDRNGKEIWEGDIVAAYGWYYRVAWTGQKFVFSLKRDDLYGPDFGYFSSEEMEVVGNIHQNPELLTA